MTLNCEEPSSEPVFIWAAAEKATLTKSVIDACHHCQKQDSISCAFLSAIYWCGRRNKVIMRGLNVHIHFFLKAVHFYCCCGAIQAAISSGFLLCQVGTWRLRCVFLPKHPFLNEKRNNCCFYRIPCTPWKNLATA
jgi:hypothetical protein